MWLCVLLLFEKHENQICINKLKVHINIEISTFIECLTYHYDHHLALYTKLKLQ